MAKGRFSGLIFRVKELVERTGTAPALIKGQVDVVLPDVKSRMSTVSTPVYPEKSPGDFGDRRVGQPPQEEPSRGCFI